METIILGYIGYRIWVIWGSYYNLPKAMLYLLKGEYTFFESKESKIFLSLLSKTEL